VGIFKQLVNESPEETALIDFLLRSYEDIESGAIEAWKEKERILNLVEETIYSEFISRWEFCNQGINDPVLHRLYALVTIRSDRR